MGSESAVVVESGTWKLDDVETELRRALASIADAVASVHGFANIYPPLDDMIDAFRAGAPGCSYPSIHEDMSELRDKAMADVELVESGQCTPAYRSALLAIAAASGMVASASLSSTSAAAHLRTAAEIAAIVPRMGARRLVSGSAAGVL